MRYIPLLITLSILTISTSYAYGTDGCDSSAVLVSHFGQKLSSTLPIDEDCIGNGKHVFTAVNQAALQTTNVKFAPVSAIFTSNDGSEDYYTVPDSEDWNFGTGDFTVDFWVAHSSVSANWYYFRAGDQTTDGIQIGHADVAGTGKFRVTINGTDNDITWVPDTVGYIHIAVVRKGSTITVYIKGLSIGSFANSSNITSGTAGLIIGMFSNDNDDLIRMDEIRITKGKARWSANFTPPTTQYCSGCEMIGAFD